MSFLGISGRRFVILGVKNKKSVAYHIAQVLAAEGAELVFSVRSEESRDRVRTLFPERPVFICDVREEGALDTLASSVAALGPVSGLVHSIAYANYSAPGAFHQTPRGDFLEAVQVSCHSLIEASRVFEPLFTRDASVVTISISSTRMAAENYGYMAPIKAALDSSVVFLAKSFSAHSEVRFNAVCAGLLKTSASAGIPGYVDSYLYAELATLRKRALETGEVANVTAFLLSPRSSGINAQRIEVDCGMGVNYFDRALVRR